MTESPPRLTFHCGLPKTGSTFLQEAVFPFTRSGTYVTGKQAFGGVVEQISRGRGCTLVSDETLTWTPLDEAGFSSRRRERTLSQIAAAWPGSQLLMFLREPSEMVRAHYAQYLHDGGPKKFEAFYRDHIFPDALRFDRLIDEIYAMPWQSILLIEYRDLVGYTQKTIRLIEHFSGLQFDMKAVGKRSNVSVSGHGARLLRMSNAFWLRGHPEHGIGLPLRVLRPRRLVRRLIQNGPLRLLNRLGPELVPAEILEGVREDFAESWRLTCERVASSQRPFESVLREAA